MLLGQTLHLRPLLVYQVAELSPHHVLLCLHLGLQALALDVQPTQSIRELLWGAKTKNTMRKTFESSLKSQIGQFKNVEQKKNLYLLVPAIQLSLENIDDLGLTQQHLLLLMELLLQSLEKLRRKR